MGLRWVGLTPDRLYQQFLDSISETRRASKKIMRAGAVEIMEASKQMAPVDDHELERAHTLAVLKLNQDNMLMEIEVGGVIDGVDVDAYAWLQHERLEPAGPWRLGPKSVAKDSQNPAGRTVGGKFLERAAEELEPEIVERMKEALPGN